MKRILPVLVLLAPLAGCSGAEAEVLPGAPIDTLVAAEGLENQRLVVCADGTGKARGTFFLRSLWPAKLDVQLVGEGVSASSRSREIHPGDALRVDVEVEDIFRTLAVSVLDPHGRTMKHIAVKPDVDERVLEVQPEPVLQGGIPRVVVRNPMPFDTRIKLRTRGGWKTESESAQRIPGRSEVEIPLVPASEKPFRPGIAALVRIEGTRCSKTSLPDLPIVRIPESATITETAPRPAR